jgi:hypothetical protein
MPARRSEEIAMKNVLILASLLLVGTSTVSAQPTDEHVPVGGFVDLEWRVFNIGGHVSHGPSVAAGVTFADGAFRVGLGGLGRPGPWNPRTFDVTLADGETYRGQSTLSLRSDGGMFGLHLAGAFEIPRAHLAILLPVTIGYGGFGFYLTGEDRDTPDGRRVSAWENELFRDRDSHIGIVLDAGLRVAFVLRRTPYVRPYVGASFTAVPGFDTMVRSSYSGFSFATGVEVGYGL